MTLWGISPSPAFSAAETSSPLPPKEVRFSVAQLSTPLSQVSGILLKSLDPKRVYVLTVLHFLTQSFPGEELPSGKILESSVQWVDPTGSSEEGQLSPSRHSARLIKIDETLDLALLETSPEDSSFPFTATLATEAELENIHTYDSVWSIGFPAFSSLPENSKLIYQLPLKALFPIGLITTHSSEPAELWTTSAPNAPGGSGGGIFAVKHRKLIGMQFAVPRNARGSYPNTNLFIPGHVLIRFLRSAVEPSSKN